MPIATPEQIDLVLGNIKESLIPELKIENEWEFKDNQIYALYSKYPYPRFFLGPLKKAFEIYISNELGINLREKTFVGCHKYTPKKIISLDSFFINPAFLDRPYLKVKAQRLTIRLKESGITFMFWAHACRSFSNRRFH
ncbi:MAG: hypothetical protein ACTSRG_17520 [Candidatus Helarchaeota archaeon]